MGFISKRLHDTGDPIGETTNIVQSLEKRGIDVIKLIMGDPARYFGTQQNVAKAYENAINEGKTFYLEGPGLSELRSAVVERYSDLYNINFSKDKVIITQGVIEALQFLNHALIYKNDSAILLAPFFTQYVPCITLQEGKPSIAYHDEAKDWDINMESIENALKKSSKKPKYMLITTPNNPTGTVIPEKSIKEIVEFAKNNDLFIVSDEIYDEIIYNHAKFTSIGKIAKGIPHMILNGASKNYIATGFRIGFSIIPEEDKKSKELMEAFTKLSYSRLSANTPSQYAVLEGLRNKKAHNNYISSILPKIASRSTLAAKLINKTEYLRAIIPNSAFYVFAKINLKLLDIKNDKEFVETLLKEEHVHLTKGSSFGMEGYVRLVSLPEEKIIKEAIERIERFCKRHKRNIT